MSLRQRQSKVSSTEQMVAEELRRLYHYHELPEWQKDNHFILSGYVKETSSYKECLKSLSYVHNESGNIYSHLLPAILVSGIVSKFLVLDLQKLGYILSNWEMFNFVQFGFAATFCLTLSASFHLFKSHSHVVCKFGNQCDYFGIIIMITCSLISIILFAFNDVPNWRNFYVALFLLLGGVCTKVTFDQKFSTPHYRPFRSLMFILFGLSGALPIVTAVSIFGFGEAFDRSNAVWLIAEGIFYILGACLYAMRVPERFTHTDVNDQLLGQGHSGPFDLIGHSHQIFHVMVVVAAYCHWKALVGCFEHLQNAR